MKKKTNNKEEEEEEDNAQTTQQTSEWLPWKRSLTDCGLLDLEI
jgi:hypothetical protein